MSDNFSRNKPRLPSHIAYHVEDGGDDNSYWHRIGAAWPTKGNGLSIRVGAIPVDGHIELRPREEIERMRKERKAEQEQVQNQEMKPTV